MSKVISRHQVPLRGVAGDEKHPFTALSGLTLRCDLPGVGLTSGKALRLASEYF